MVLIGWPRPSHDWPQSYNVRKLTLELKQIKLKYFWFTL